jgi:hypothetical protein
MIPIDATPNKSLDVRAKQLLCLVSCPLNLSLRVAVSPHVNSGVRWLSYKLKRCNTAS